MEEDIIRIEEIKKEYSTMDGLKEYVKAIENILNRLEQDERVIEEMESKLKEIQDEYLDFCPDCVDLANDLLKIIDHFRKRVESNECNRKI